MWYLSPSFFFLLYVPSALVNGYIWLAVCDGLRAYLCSLYLLLWIWIILHRLLSSKWRRLQLSPCYSYYGTWCGKWFLKREWGRVIVTQDHKGGRPGGKKESDRKTTEAFCLFSLGWYTGRSLCGKWRNYICHPGEDGRQLEVVSIDCCLFFPKIYVLLLRGMTRPGNGKTNNAQCPST